jgi:hypothetical protein
MAEQHLPDSARVAPAEELDTWLYHGNADVLLGLLDNPALEELHICLLLRRIDLPVAILEEIARRKTLLKSARIRRGLAFHPNTPRLIGMSLVRDLYLMDLVQLTLLPAVSPELKRRAEEHILARIPQLPLGQKITLARRGPARVAGFLLAEGHPRIIKVALDNASLTEAQVLRVLARQDLNAQVAQEIGKHRKWSCQYSIRVALVRHPNSPLGRVLSYLRELTLSDLQDLASPGIVPENLRKYLQAEILRRNNAKETF